MPQGPPPPPPLGIAFDTSMTRMTDALALVMVYGLENKGEAHLTSASISVPNIAATAFVESLTRKWSGSRFPLPIGMSTDGSQVKAAWPKAPATMPMSGAAPSNDPGLPASTVRKLNDTADAVALIRNGLTTLKNGDGVVVAAGPATTLAHMLELKDSVAVIVEKSKLLVLAVGGFGDNAKPDPAIAANLAAMRKVLSSWPMPIVVCGTEVGEAALFPAESINKDFAWLAGEAKEDQPTQSMAAVLYAGRTKDAPFKLSPPGTISVTDDGRTKFTASADGKHRYMIFDPTQKEAMLTAYNELARAKPRPVRQFPRPPA